jgi:transcriptional antiterminator NusG
MAEIESVQPEERNPSEAEPLEETDLHGEDLTDMQDSEDIPMEESPPIDTELIQGDENLDLLVERLVDDTKAVEEEEELDPSEGFLAEMIEGVETTAETPVVEEIELDEEVEEAQISQPVEEVDDGRRWYVVHCYSGYENKVRHNLEQRIETMGMKDRIFDVVVPTEEEIEVKDGKRKTIERRVFPGYILVQMIMTEESWYVVRNTPGVTGFVGMGNEPTPLRPEEVSSIIKRMEAEAPRIKVTYKIGQKVRIIDGPFNDFIGTVDDIDMERAKVRVMVSFFGRETPVELDFLQVEKA